MAEGKGGHRSCDTGEKCSSKAKTQRASLSNILQQIWCLIAAIDSLFEKERFLGKCGRARARVRQGRERISRGAGQIERCLY